MNPANPGVGLLRAISASLGGDVVIWTRINIVTGMVTIVDVVDPLPVAQVMADRISRVPQLAPRSLTSEAAQSSTVVIHHSTLGDASQWSVLPDAWQEYLDTYPVQSVLAVPRTIDPDTIGVLITARRTGEIHTDDDRQLAITGTERLVGRRSPTPAVHVAEPSTFSILLPLERSRGWVAAALLGVGLQAIVALSLGWIDGSAKYRPGALLLLCCVLAAVLGGVRAACTSAFVSTMLLWVVFTEPRYSLRVHDRQEIVGLVIFAFSAVGVVLLVHQLELARFNERSERRIADALLDQAPVAMATFDRDLRFQRVNRMMELVNGRTAAEHIGRRPDDLSPIAGQLYEHLLAKTRDSGTAITDHDISLELPEVGVEHHWRVSYQPLRDVDDDRVIGVSTVVTDMTQEVTTRRRAERLLALSERLATAIDESQIAESVCWFIVDVLKGRSSVSRAQDGLLTIIALAGFNDREVDRWADSVSSINDASPIAQAVSTGRPVIIHNAAEFDVRYPALAQRRTDDWDIASLSMPLVGEPGNQQAAGALYVGWPTERVIGAEITTLLATVASLTTLAIGRIEAARTAHQIEFRSALDAMIDNVTIARSIRGEDGSIEDFMIEFVNSNSIDGAHRDPDSLVGQHVCDLYPHWRQSGLFDRFCSVVENGVPYQADRVHYQDTIEDGTTIEGFWSLQVVKFGDGYLAASRDVTAFVEAERLAHLAAQQSELERTAIELLQEAALPKELPAIPGAALAAVYQPADPRQPVGGDWYDVFMLDERRVALVIADVAGHGRSAAAFMLQVRNVFRAIAIEHAEPGEVLHRANDVTTRLNDVDGPFVTCCYAVLDTVSHSLQWAMAGHFAPIVMSNTGVTTVLPGRPGIPLAIRSQQRYQSMSTTLMPGDRVVLFTDGLVERRREHLDISLARLQRLLSERRDLLPQQLVDSLAFTVVDRFDDLAVLCLAIAE